MKFFLLILVSALQICFSCVGLVFATTFGKPEASWDGDPRYDLSWQEPQAKLDADDGTVLSPDQTLNLLKSLEEKYKIRGDEESKNKYERVQSLLKIAELSAKPCSQIPDNVFELVQKQLSLDGRYPNVLAYLKHHRNILYETCRQVMIEDLKRDVDTLPRSFEYIFKGLKHSMVWSNLQEPTRQTLFDISQQAIQDGVIDYMDRQLDPFREKVVKARDGKQVFKVEFERLIIRPCTRLAVDKPFRIGKFKILSDDKDIVKEFDPFVRSWLENYNLCSNIIHYSGGVDLLQEISLNTLSSKNKKPSSMKRMWWLCKNCIYISEERCYCPHEFV